MSEAKREDGKEAGFFSGDEFASLLQKEFKPKTDRAKERVEAAVRTLAQQALENSKVVGNDVFATIDQLKAELDRKLTDQINLILHNPEFQKLESAWRGLDYLVGNSETGKDLKIKVMNITKDELGKMFKQYKGQAWDQSPLFKKIYEAEYGQLGGQPYGALMGDYFFDHSPPDVDILAGLSKIAAASHAPFIAAAGPGLMGMDNWQQIVNPRDLGKLFDTIDYAEWRAFRDSEDSKYVALAMPRFLARRPYGAKSEPVDEFAFEEDSGVGGDPSKYSWTNAAYAMALNINRSFKDYGWCSRIRGVQSGGLVENLPFATFPTDDGAVDMKCPTEVAISDRREAELSAAGLLPLIHRKNTNAAAFIGAQSVQKPKRYEDPAATSNANLAARLPYLFASCRFAHYLKCMVRDWIGKYATAASLEEELMSWVSQYVDQQPDSSSEDTKCKQPLREASIQVVADEENPGYYKGKFRFVPHYQLEGMDIGISMVSRLPKAKS
jgi:type VI secretion system protein ImpC